MFISISISRELKKLQARYVKLKKGKLSLLALIDESEISEAVYNSNAIENSTLSLKETERILLEMEVSRTLSLREAFEAKNLARVMEYLRNLLPSTPIDRERILLLHQMLLGNIDDKIAGRFRQKGEYVRVGTHVAPAPETIEKRMAEILDDIENNLEEHPLDRITRFHLDFETLHPFIDGNGRMGRLILNRQLVQFGYPTLIIRNKEKHLYYQAFRDYHDKSNAKPMARLIARALKESFHKRLAYLEDKTIIPLTHYAKKHRKRAPAVLNAARRQNIPAFRERGVWKIGVE